MDNKRPSILIVDDDSHIREVVRYALQAAGFSTTEAADGLEAVAQLEHHSPDLVLLDIVMPGLDGTEVCKIIRSRCEVPIVFLSSRDEEIDRILGLELGGDDYVTKPFSPRELVARVKAVLRRVERHGPPGEEPDSSGTSANTAEHGQLKLDFDRFEAYWGDRKVVLTVTEFNIVRTLMRYPGKVFSRDELMEGAYTYDTVVSDRTIDSHVRRVRKKFSAAGGDPVETVHGVGYRLGSCDDRRRP
jgi:two-component system OmpR family response regulator